MWSKIPKLQGLRAANNWLRKVAPDRQERILRNFVQGIRKIERALAQEPESLRTLQIIVEDSRFFGRIDGLREGLELYEFGTRIQRENTAAFQTIMNYIARCAGRYQGEALDGAISAERVCEYLDREIKRTKHQKTSSIRINPPDKWGCASWKAALENKGNNVRNLVSKARKEALSDQYWTLMAWKTWCKGTTVDNPAASSSKS
jgi:hypothetical protein